MLLIYLPVSWVVPCSHVEQLGEPAVKFQVVPGLNAFHPAGRNFHLRPPGEEKKGTGGSNTWFPQVPSTPAGWISCAARWCWRLVRNSFMEYGGVEPFSSAEENSSCQTLDSLSKLHPSHMTDTRERVGGLGVCGGNVCVCVCVFQPQCANCVRRELGSLSVSCEWVVCVYDTSVWWWVCVKQKLRMRERRERKRCLHREGREGKRERWYGPQWC